MTIIGRLAFLVLILELWISSVSAQQLETAAQEIANQISLSMVSEEKRMIAILPLTDLYDKVTPEGMAFAEELLSRLFLLRQGKFEIVERTKTREVWNEQRDFSEQWVIDNLQGFSRILGADAILVGTIIPLEGYRKVNTRLVAVPSGTLLAAASSRMQGSAAQGGLEQMNDGGIGSMPSVERPCPINNSYQCAARMPLGARDSDAFRDSHDTRYYSFAVAEAGSYKLTLNPVPNSRFVLMRLYFDDGSYTRVAEKRFDAGKPGALLATIRLPGRYFVELDPGSCCSGAPYDYGFAVERQ